MELNDAELTDARRWRLKALEALAIAEHMTNPECRAVLLKIAASYDHLADMAEGRKPEGSRLWH